MSENMIEKWEQETGQRWDSQDGNNLTMAGIFGELSCLMGKTAQAPRDDLAAGVLIQAQMLPEYQEKKRSEEAVMSAFMSLIQGGVDPKDAHDLLK